MMINLCNDDSDAGKLNSRYSHFPHFSRWKVSAKIQQLLNTLKKPKRRPLPEFYEDDDKVILSFLEFHYSHFHLNHIHFPKELELAATAKDPGAPLPEGSAMTPAVGAQLVIPAGLPRNLEAAIQRYVLIVFISSLININV